MATKNVTYAGRTFAVDENLTPEEIQAMMAGTFPELANYQYRENTNGDLSFSKVTGTKG